MEKQKKWTRNILVYATVVMMLCVGLAYPISSANLESLKRYELEDNAHQTEADIEYEIILIETKPIGSSEKEQIEIKIEKSDYINFIDEYNTLMQKNISDQKKAELLFDLFNKYNILTEPTTIDDLKKTADNIQSTLIKKYRLPKKYGNLLGGRGNLIIDEVIVGLGCTFFFASFMNTIAPFAWPPEGFWKFIDEEITIPLFGQDVTFGCIGTCSAAAFDLLIGQSINFGWIHTMIPLGDCIFLQPFYGILLFPAGISFTIYQKTNPPVILFDCIIGACVLGNIMTFHTFWE